MQFEQVPDIWFKEKDEKVKHIDIYWPKVFDIQNAAGERKYTLLSKVVRTVCHCKTQMPVWREVF